MPTGALRARLPAWLAALALAGCPAGGPSEDRPWALALAEGDGAAEAAELAAELGAGRPELEGAVAVSLPSPEGPLRHLVVSRPVAEQAEAVALRAALLQGRPGQLELLDFRGLPQPVSREQAASEASAPEDAAELERLAAWLPQAADAQILDLLLLEAPARLARGPLPLEGWAAPRPWARAFAGLGWAALGQARYRLGQGGEAHEVRVFVGLADPGAGEGPDALRRVFDFLQEHVRADEPAAPAPPEATRPDRKAKKKKARPRGPRGRPAPPPPAPVGSGELALVPVVKELPAPEPRVLPWGPAEVVVVPRVALVPARKMRADTRLATAWIAWLPERKGVALFLLDDPARAAPWLAPRGLVPPRGLQLHPLVRLVWRCLPDAVPGGERLSHLGATRLRTWLPRDARGKGGLDALGDRPVLFAGYRSERAAWQMLWAALGDPAAARILFEEGLVQPRQRLMQGVLSSKRSVRYDVGVSLRELGDVQAWQFLGAAEGRLQELYFQRQGEVWLLAGSGPASGDSASQMSVQDFLARADSLPFWPAGVE